MVAGSPPSACSTARLVPVGRTVRSVGGPAPGPAAAPPEREEQIRGSRIGSAPSAISALQPAAAGLRREPGQRADRRARTRARSPR